jgi:hypothetical protein
MPGSGLDHCGRRWRCALLATAAAALPMAAPAQLATLVGADGSTTPAAPWAYAGLPEQKPPPTRYSVVERDGRRVLRIEADRSYGNLVHPLPGVAAGVLAWRWRVDQALPGMDLTQRDGDDAALKVCAMFDLPRERVPFVERQLLRLAESRLGEALPTATLCYVWAPMLPRSTLLRNAYTARVRFITLDGRVGEWSDEQHDLARDFLRAFGDEAQGRVPPLRAIAIGADADNTGGRSLAWLDALEHRPAPAPAR